MKIAYRLAGTALLGVTLLLVPPAVAGASDGQPAAAPDMGLIEQVMRRVESD